MAKTAAAPMRPLTDHILLEPLEEAQVGSILIPDKAKPKPVKGTVLALGPGKRDTQGCVWGIDLNVGDKVYFQKFSELEVEFSRKKYLVVREEDILGVIIEE